jgi:hypothetical protein
VRINEEAGPEEIDRGLESQVGREWALEVGPEMTRMRQGSPRLIGQ